ncbi:hypothetical protein GJ633_09335 [Halorubrum sp. CBA1125]|uniref:hypothetical protein n=1 Tax=Halorubrum sp. CBA1125 TaxID=2668072 RepID=UPI0012E7FAAE|nr:hypothetical protein [Halorubrum sp. CBA1125]MUW14842.1 hypothetical protein [Halorubrum sp. CBA1125]
MSENQKTIEEYPHNTQIVRERRHSAADRYHYVNAFGEREKSFESESKARLFADVQTVTGGFREEKTGERGVPPTVARAREDALMAYLASNETMGVEWVARAFDVDEEVVRNNCQMVQKRAATVREANDE